MGSGACEPAPKGAGQGDVEEERCEVLIADDAAVDGEDEGTVAKLGYVVQDAPQIGELHADSMLETASIALSTLTLP